MSFPNSLKLLLSLFRISLRSPFLSDAVTEKLHATWQQGIRTVLAQTGFELGESGFLYEIMGCLRDAVYGEADTVAVLKHLVSVALRIRSVVLEVCDDPGLEDCLVERLCCTFHSSSVTCWKNVLIVGRDLLFCSSDLVESVPVSSDTVPKCIAPVAFTSLLMMEIIAKLLGKPEMPEHSPKSKGEADDAAEERASQDSDKVDSNELSVGSDAKDEPEFLVRDCNLLVDMAEGLAFCRAVTRNRFLSRASSELCLVMALLEENYVKWTSLLSQAALRKIMAASIDRSMKEGDLSCLGLQILLQRLRELRSEWDYFGAVGGLEQFTPLTASLVTTLQVMMPFFEVESIFQLAEFQFAQMMSCLGDDISEFVGKYSLQQLFNHVYL